MSQLPNAASALVDDVKVRDYLLNGNNPQNAGKAALFERSGFDPLRWDILADALRAHPLQNEVVRTVPSPHGIKYVVECMIKTPDGRNPCMISVWIIENGRDLARLVTAY